MRFPTRRFAQCALAASCLTLVGPLAAADVQQVVDFRDGSILRLRLPDTMIPWRRVSEAGELTKEPVKLSEVDRLWFVLTPVTEQVAEVRKLVLRLGSDDYHERERAQAELLRRGAKFRKILEQMLPQTEDFEVRWRLREILKLLPEGEGTWSNDYDRLKVKGSDEEIRGDLGDWSLTVAYRGAEVTINRANALGLRSGPLDLEVAAQPPATHVERIPRDDDGLFPKDVTRIDFDRGPRGEPIALGTDIAETYVPWGCTFSTSVADSYVAIEPYNVGGRSGRRCAATHKPLYQGILTVRFCKPGNARLPAGVRYVGFWTSHVARGGTALQAYDARGRRIAEIKTVRNTRDFLALTANVPIAYIKVVPDEQIDPDYAIDDLVFDTPKLLSEAGEPDRYSVVLTTGERLHCAVLEKTGQQVLLKNLTLGADRLRIPAGLVAVLVPPKSPIPQPAEQRRCFVRLTDGSVLRARGDAGLQLDRFPGLPVDANRLVALWGAETTPQKPPEGTWPEHGALMILEDEEQPTIIPQWRLGQTWIEADVLSTMTDYSYANSPVIWFRKPAKRPRESGLVRTATGEEIVLGAGGAFALKDWSAASATITYGKRQWTLPLGEVRSLLLPKASKEK